MFCLKVTLKICDFGVSNWQVDEDSQDDYQSEIGNKKSTKNALLTLLTTGIGKTEERKLLC
jgi:hypothetical protein